MTLLEDLGKNAIDLCAFARIKPRYTGDLSSLEYV